MKEITGEEHQAMLANKKPRNQAILVKPLILAAAAIILIGLGFFGGMQYQKSNHKSVTAPTVTNQNTGGQLGPGSGFGGRRGLGRRNVGQVTAISSTSITIKGQSGTSTTLAITGTTTVTNNGQAAAVSDIKVGDTVAAVPDPANPSQALRILLNPNFGGGAAPSTSPSTDNSQTLSN